MSCANPYWLPLHPQQAGYIRNRSCTIYAVSAQQGHLAATRLTSPLSMKGFVSIHSTTLSVDLKVSQNPRTRSFQPLRASHLNTDRNTAQAQHTYCWTPHKQARVYTPIVPTSLGLGCYRPVTLSCTVWFNAHESFIHSFMLHL
jgi:hypothetical protein